MECGDGGSRGGHGRGVEEGGKALSQSQQQAFGGRCTRWADAGRAEPGSQTARLENADAHATDRGNANRALFSLSPWGEGRGEGAVVSFEKSNSPLIRASPTFSPGGEGHSSAPSGRLRAAESEGAKQDSSGRPDEGESEGESQSRAPGAAGLRDDRWRAGKARKAGRQDLAGSRAGVAGALANHQQSGESR